MKRSFPDRMFAIGASALLAGAIISVGCNKTYPDQKGQSLTRSRTII